MAVPSTDDIHIPLLNYISDGELHTLTGCVLHLQKYFELTKDEKIQVTSKIRKKQLKYSYVPLILTDFYVRVQLAVTNFRNAKPKSFLRDLPGTKSIGVFLISNEGMELLKLPKSERLEKMRKAKNLRTKINKGKRSKK
tara:strand:+ start:116 stop:532 length:417 start_codon:yes stop_codon:yes gene_type:complete